MDDWYEEFLGGPYDPIDDAEEYLKTRDVLSFHRLYTGNNLYEIAELHDDPKDFTTYLEDIRPDVSWLYNRLREHFEELEEYEKCSICVELEHKIRHEYLELQIRNEKKENQRNTRRMGVQKPKE